MTVGCPVRAREWILPTWFEHVRVAAEAAQVDLDFVFVVPNDDPTQEVIGEHCPAPFRIVPSGERVETDTRFWSPARYRHMTILRNWLLTAVREQTPDYFLSLDSDILLHPLALHNLIETAGNGWEAVGGKCWMTDHTDACSYINLVNTAGFSRPDVHTVVPVDVIMAIKLLSPEVYNNVSYVFDQRGEDIGYSYGITARGLKIAFDGRVCSRHVMSQYDSGRKPRLDKIDPRCGF